MTIERSRPSSGEFKRNGDKRPRPLFLEKIPNTTCCSGQSNIKQADKMDRLRTSPRASRSLSLVPVEEDIQMAKRTTHFSPLFLDEAQQHLFNVSQEGMLITNTLKIRT